jgi:hypothetical protein
VTQITGYVVQLLGKQLAVKIVDPFFKKEIRAGHNPTVGIVPSQFQRFDPHLKTVFRYPILEDGFNFFPDGFHRH